MGIPTGPTSGESARSDRSLARSKGSPLDPNKRARRGQAGPHPPFKDMLPSNSRSQSFHRLSGVPRGIRPVKYGPSGSTGGAAGRPLRKSVAVAASGKVPVEERGGHIGVVAVVTVFMEQSWQDWGVTEGGGQWPGKPWRPHGAQDSDWQ